MPACPNCGSQRVWKDGLRHTINGNFQRYICRECGYRFSENSGKQKNRELLRKFVRELECQDCDESHRRALVSLAGTISLAAEPQNEKRAAGATDELEADIKGKLVEYAWHEKKRGLAETTILQRIYKLKQLIERGANLLDPESVSAALASSNLSPSYKKSLIIAYKSFAKTYKLAWEPPRVRVERKVPFIPTEGEIDALIAGCGRKTAAFLQVLKDTGARGSEACRLKWEDIDEKTNTIRINNPTKGSLARVVKVSPKTIAMLNSLPRNSEYIFNTNVSSIRKNFTKQRNKIAAKLQNPRLKQIHLHTIRHWKATMEYYKTKNIKWVQYVLGHKKIENTDIYTHLVNFEGDEWHVAVAKDLEEEKKLIEVGFEFVRYSEKDGVAIYRKRK